MKIQPLSTLYKQCRLPGVEKDIFGHPLNMGNVSDMFIKGTPVLVTNYNKEFKRPQPLNFYLAKEGIKAYLSQFKGIDFTEKLQQLLDSIK